MKTHLFIGLLCAAAFAAHAQSTAFTYPGRLAGSGAPYTGFAEMQFTLFSGQTGGVALATSTPAITGVNVSAGQFTTTLDFGAAAFSGANRFLEIQVRTNVGAFTTLTPRQPLTPTPYALYAPTAGTAQGPWVTSGSDLSYTAGKVGIGTTFPSTSLHIAHGATPIIVLQNTGPASTQSGYIGFWNDTKVETASVGFIAPGSKLFSVVNTRSGGHIALLPIFGNVGIGTTTPQARLDVRGDVRLGSTGQYYAAAGDENLRIVRGTVSGAGSRVQGAGFDVIRISEGDYLVTFLPQYATPPSVTATVDDVFESFSIADFYVASVFNPTISSVRIRVRGHHITSTGDNGVSDRPFHFIAFGPRAGN